MYTQKHQHLDTWTVHRPCKTRVASVGQGPVALFYPRLGRMLVFTCGNRWLPSAQTPVIVRYCAPDIGFLGDERCHLVEDYNVVSAYFATSMREFA